MKFLNTFNKYFMKRIVTVLLLFTFYSTTFAQLWIEVGAKGTYGITALYNNEVWNSGQVNNKFSTGFGYGGRLGLNFGDNNGISLEAVMGDGKQQWEYIQGTTITTNVNSWKYLDYNILFRNVARKGYFELGPKIRTMRSVLLTEGSAETDVKNFYNNNMLGAVLGFGTNLAGNQVVALQFGVRFEYLYKDFVNADGKAKGYPFRLLSTASQSSTNMINIMACLDLNFGIGGVARASCGKRRFLFSFEY